MLEIGKSYIVKTDGKSRLCADIGIDGHKQTLWFGVDSSQEDCLVTGRADPFVMAMLPTAMRGGHEVICEDAVSERLHYQLCEYLIPALSLAGDMYRKIHITAPLTAEPYPNRGGIGTSFSNDADSLYTVSRHGSGSECPLTHIAVFHTGAFKDSECREEFFGICQAAAQFADEYGLETVFVDTNLYETLTEGFAEAASFRGMACVLALQGLFSVYLWPTADAGKFAMDVHACASFDLLTTDCAATESLTIYPDGAEAKDTEKLAALAAWEPSRRWLRPDLLETRLKRCDGGFAAGREFRGRGEAAKPDAIHIGIPRIEKSGSAVRLCADVDLFGKKEVMWFSVDEKYGEYLVDDRADAFVAGLLTPAMRKGADIICDAPVTRRLLYQLRQYLIPMLAANLQGFRPITLRAEPTDVKLPCENAVATGWTGGVDCMLTLKQTIEAEAPSRKLTHLMITSNGSLEVEDNSALLKKLVEKAENGAALELGLPVVGIDTNVQELVNENFLSVVVYRHASVVLALQKLFGTYYNSASYAFSWFAFDAENCAFYELVPLGCFRTDSTSFYSSGGPYSRVQKLRELSDYPLAHRYLHPCISALPERNCNRCRKCIGVMATLYSYGALDHFSAVFDVDLFERDMDWYLSKLLAAKNSTSIDALALLKSRGIEPSPKVKWKSFINRGAAVIKEFKKLADKDWYAMKFSQLKQRKKE